MTELLANPTVHWGVLIALAAVPVLVWFVVLFHGRKTSRLAMLLAFFLGMLTVLPILGLNALWARYSEYNIYQLIENNITDFQLAALASLVVVGVFEELTKSGVVRFVDRTRIGVKTVNDAVKFSVLAGLGFAFIENLFYFRYIFVQDSLIEAFALVSFRSIFTVCGHMVFSGIFGYYYGISKFSKPILETKLWIGERSKGIYWLSKILGTSEIEAHKEWVLLKGLFFAMAIHTAFNFLLETGQFLPVVLLILGGFFYILYLMQHKAGAILLSGLGRSSTMAKRDEDVVLELLGMWTREGRTKDVIDICQRLLLRDPDNKVVQLFQARAMDAQKLKNLENSVSSLFSSKNKPDEQTMRTLVRQKVLMDMMNERAEQPKQRTSSDPFDEDAPKVPTV